jgi:spermidine synthase
MLYCNRLQLATRFALYSDGVKYLPAVRFVGAFRKSLLQVKDVLVLGTGLGSVVSVLRDSGIYPNFTLVELDEVVLDLAMQVHCAPKRGAITPVCGDAQGFMARNSRKFDLVFVDVFIGKLVPDFVRSTEFLMQCSKAVERGGLICINYIVDDPEEWEEFSETFREVFVEVKVLAFETNRLLVGKTAGE